MLVFESLDARVDDLGSVLGESVAVRGSSASSARLI
jgi:hypothetical protein